MKTTFFINSNPNQKMNDFDKTAPWFEFLSYQFCCESLGVEPTIQKFLRYQNYLKTVRDKNGNKKHI